MKQMLRAVALVSPLLIAGSVQAAQTLPADLGVSIEIIEACTVSNIVPISFGTQGTLAAIVDSTGSVDVTCPDEVAYSIALDAGGGSGATVTTRKMTGPEDATIDYTLYQSSEHSTVWGDESGVNRKTATGSGIAQTHTIYGRVPVQTTPATGTYSDTVTIIVHY
ncbi:MAG: hypothetical protein BGN89_05510 [Alphaproteobacteria bacterium 64-6]|uniref:Csu type fimbrial protein n=1 Tax=Hyphomicrobium sp. CS1BSMeth3 TaxID=1892844 RepID=UPI0008695022|nr:spore coat U domain-containing protein [Hyphomicrobium sp. CS1BSMeth3]ODT18959.1 MAG: hypothetical protein ABS54_15700 [Hyphomicrobium sp. SCN 65-11]OJU28243.1 MAG: hypothetical protein BGN89_05510 [Alphaproteobacteria bacterium 64-6]